MSAITKEQVLDAQPSHRSGRWYTEDEINDRIIQEYENFKNSLKEQKQQLFETNLGLAKTECEKFFTILKEYFKVSTAIHLKYASLSTFEAIVELPERIYFSTEFDKVYDIAHYLTSASNHRSFIITYSYMPSNKRINYAALLSDGFQLTYKDVKKAPPRSA